MADIFFLILLRKLAAAWKQNPPNWKRACNSSESLSQVIELHTHTKEEKLHFPCKALQSRRAWYLNGPYTACSCRPRLHKAALRQAEPCAAVLTGTRQHTARPTLRCVNVSVSPSLLHATRQRYQPLPSLASLFPIRLLSQTTHSWRAQAGSLIQPAENYFCVGISNDWGLIVLKV